MDKYYCISFDGIDKAGKGQIKRYVEVLANYYYVLMDRGPISNLTYARLGGRKYDYDLDQMKNWLFVVLVCDEKDWKIRCKFTNEPKIDYQTNVDEFKKTREEFEKKGFKTLEINTSHMTPYDSALKIIETIKALNSLEK